MNQKVWSLLLIAVLTLSLSCNKSNVIEADAGYEYPVAAFSYTGNDGPSPVNIQFTNYSETIIEDYCTDSWTFGENGATSDEKNPLKTFYKNCNYVSFYYY